MPPSRNDEERQRLANLYATKTDAELEYLADAASSLTDLACETLRSEIDRRGLTINTKNSPDSSVETRSPGLVTIRRCLNVDEALLAKSVLDSAGIPCFLGDQNTIRIDWLLSNALGGVKVLVKAEDVEAANELLVQSPPESFALEGSDIYAQPQCPSCGSSDVSLGATGTIKYGPFTITLPRPPEPDGWTCNACGHRWEDELHDG